MPKLWTGKLLVSGAWYLMAKKLYQRLLEVEIFHLTPTQWEWRVYEGDTPLKTGLAASRDVAQTDGDTALFRLLAASGC